MRENEFKIDLLAKLTEVEQIFRDGRPEILLISTTTEEQKSMLFTGTRQFLRERGLKIEDSEPISVQLLCKDPNGNSGALNLLVIRKACKFASKMKISSVFVI
jgi:hypothetical protein